MVRRYPHVGDIFQHYLEKAIGFYGFYWFIVEKRPTRESWSLILWDIILFILVKMILQGETLRGRNDGM